MAAAAPFVFAASEPLIPDDHSTIHAILGQVELLKYVGGVIVSGLAVAVTTLYFALQKAQKESMDLQARSLQSYDKMNDTIDHLNTELKGRPCLLSKKE